MATKVPIYVAAVCTVIFLLSCSSRQSSSELPDCDISQGACVKTVMNRKVALDIMPKPVESMRELSFRLTVEGIKESELVLELEMPGMYMGENRVLLKKAEGVYEGSGVIPRCPSRKKLWQATVDIPGQGKVSFRFNVAR